MRVVNPERRLYLYKAMLHYIKSYDKKEYIYPFGLCYAHDFVKSRLDPPIYQNLQRYPELHKHRPEYVQRKKCRIGYWFETGTKEGVEIRINILTDCINTVKKEIENGTV